MSPPCRIGLPSKKRYEDNFFVEKYQLVVVEVLSEFPTDEKETFAVRWVGHGWKWPL